MLDSVGVNDRQVFLTCVLYCGDVNHVQHVNTKYHHERVEDRFINIYHSKMIKGCIQNVFNIL